MTKKGFRANIICGKNSHRMLKRKSIEARQKEMKSENVNDPERTTKMIFRLRCYITNNRNLFHEHVSEVLR